MNKKYYKLKNESATTHIGKLMNEKTIYFTGGIILLITAFFSTGYHQFDEHFQILEFASLKLHLTKEDNLAWEYFYDMRPSIQPWMVVLTHYFFQLFNIDNPFIITFFLRLLSASISFLSMYLLYKAYCNKINNDVLKKWFLILCFLLWFLIYKGVRFSSENLSGSTFLIAYSLFLLKQPLNKQNYLFTGLLLGLSFTFRFQVGFLIAGFILWLIFINKTNIRNLTILSFGLLITIGVGILMDRLFYGKWGITFWNYFEQGILLGKAAQTSVDPWWYYIKEVFIQTIPPFSIVFIASMFIVFLFKPKDILTWTIFPYLIMHFILEHKELRYLFPIIGFLPIIIIKAIEVIQQKWKRNFLDHSFSKIL